MAALSAPLTSPTVHPCVLSFHLSSHARGGAMAAYEDVLLNVCFGSEGDDGDGTPTLSCRPPYTRLTP